MYLSLLLKHVLCCVLCGTLEKSVDDIIYDSRKDARGCVFVCLRGFYADGHDYISSVIDQGVHALVVEADLDAARKQEICTLAAAHQVTVIETIDTRKALGEMSRAFFDYPERKLILFGITGTKGKTTAAGLLRAVLCASGKKVGLMGTIEIDTGGRRYPCTNTTPESYLVQKYLHEMVKNGCEAAVMEVSSQGLMCHRVEGVAFDYGVITNISPDHIGPGEHSSFEEYIHFKGQLFCQCAIGLANGVNSYVREAIKGHSCKMEYFMGAELSEHLTESHKPSVTAHNIRPWIKAGKNPVLGMKFLAKDEVRGDACGLSLGLPGRFNVENALPVIRIARRMGISWADIQNGLENAEIPGRCQVLAHVGGGYFILDYAHNGQALEAVLKTLRLYEPGRLICIFGCGGNRSKLRRSLMARAGASWADMLIITTDNPRYEAPEEIIHDIVSEIELCKKNMGERPAAAYQVIKDRQTAVEYGLSCMQPGDMVLLAGKGHETYQEIEGKRYPFDEAEIVENWIKKRGSHEKKQ